MAKLALVRHGESEWNAKGLWTGFTDISLTKKGRLEARRAASAIKDIPFSIAFTSALKRAQETLQEIITTNKLQNLPIEKSAALNERDYGELTGKNKWKMKEEYGEEQFLKWRRGWDHPIPGGESLKDVFARVIPYYTQEILPLLKEGKNVLVAAHGNSLRALIKYLDNISDPDISKLEMATGDVYLYEIDPQGSVVSKEITTQKN